MIYLVDNYDSFVHNLARYFRLVGQQTVVVRNDGFDVDQLIGQKIDAIVISPGPCSPNEAGRSLELVERLYDKIPILGICLGHQVIVQALGGQVVRSDRPVHGSASLVTHDERHEFAGIVNPFPAARYHSLIADPDTLPDCLEVSARTAGGTIMAIRHRERPVYGWQFHPESILTEPGFELLGQFLNRVGVPVAKVPTIDREKLVPDKTDAVATEYPTSPITF